MALVFMDFIFFFLLHSLAPDVITKWRVYRETMLLILSDRHVSAVWPSCEKHISLRENKAKDFSLLQDPDDILSTSGGAFMQLFVDVRHKFAYIYTTHTNTQ